MKSFLYEQKIPKDLKKNSTPSAASEVIEKETTNTTNVPLYKEKEYVKQHSFNLLDFPFEKTIMSIWDRNGNKVHKKLIDNVSKEQKKEEVKKNTKKTNKP